MNYGPGAALETKSKAFAGNATGVHITILGVNLALLRRTRRAPLFAEHVCPLASLTSGGVPVAL